MNKTNIELLIPNPDDDKESITAVLDSQTQHLVELWRAVLTTYKKAGIRVPTISVKRVNKEVKQPTELQLFVKDLLDYHLNRIPQANQLKQRLVIQQLYESGHTDQGRLKKLYDECVKEYPATSWFTVRYWLNKPKEESKDDIDFARVELQEEAIESIKDRLKKTHDTS